MRKKIITGEGRQEADRERDWLDLAELAQVEFSSEDPAHPIESALQGGVEGGWRAAEPGVQSLRLSFDQPQRIRLIRLQFDEANVARTQEFVLRWSNDGGKSLREIVRQQFNFTPPGTSREEEDYTVELSGVTTLELQITPDIGGLGARASLSRLRLA